MVLERKYDEKRLFCRMEINAEITFTVPGEDNSYTGQCINLSHSGIMFIAGQALPEGESLEVIIDTRSDKLQPMEALVEIIRVEPLEDNQYKTAAIIKEFK